MALDPAMLAPMKVDYEESSLTVAAIGEKYGCSASYVSRMARTHGWILRTQRLGRTPRAPAVLSQQARALIAHRMCSIINKKLDQMEKDMDSGVLTSPDLERDSKTIGSMVIGVEKIVPRSEEDKESKRDAAEAAPVAEDDAVERLQREIIERFERIQRRRDAARGSE
jgi:hypothetical protein